MCIASGRSGQGQTECFFVVASEILYHDAQAATMLLNTLIGELRRRDDVDWDKVEHIICAADCGPHFRSKENVDHYCVVLPKVLGVSVEVCWLGEQHGKSGVDRCFRWCNQWVSTYTQTRNIHGISDLKECFSEGAAMMMAEDPRGARIAVLHFEPGPKRPSKRIYFRSGNFKMSRTYSLTGKLSPHNRLGVSIRNKHFSDMVGDGDLLEWDVLEEIKEAIIPWRRAYYDQPCVWEQPGPQAGEANPLARRHAEQFDFVTQEMRNPRRSFLE